MLDHRSNSPAAVRALLRARGRERQARYRQRQREGRIMIALGLLPHEVDKLYRLHCIDLVDLENRVALERALHLLIDAIKER
jgi:hypothetical protein